MTTIKATPLMCYQRHKSTAKARGIEFDLTFDEWWAIWEPHFDRRGRASDALQMCRTADAGGYTVGNVRIDTCAANQAERAQLYVAKQRQEGRLPAVDRSPGMPDWLCNRSTKVQIRLCDDDFEDEGY